MQKFRQYRMKKKITKLFNAPVPEDESYIPADNNLYPTNQSLHISDGGLDSAEELRMTLVDKVSNLVLQQIANVQRWEQDDNNESRLVRQTLIEEGFGEIDILLEEFDRGLILSESERTDRKRSRDSSFAESTTEQSTEKVDLGQLETQVTTWQQEKRRRRNKLHRMDRSIHQLSLSVHDSRCRRIMLDRRLLVDGVNNSVNAGFILLRNIRQKVQIAYVERLTT